VNGNQTIYVWEELDVMLGGTVPGGSVPGGSVQGGTVPGGSVLGGIADRKKAG